MPPSLTWPNSSVLGVLGYVVLAQDYALADRDYAPALAVLGALLEEVRYLVEVRFHLGDEGDVRGAGDARAPGDPTGVPPHDLDHHDPLVALGRGPYLVYGVGGDGDGRVVAEGRVGGRKVVVYGLGAPDDLDAEVVVEPLGDPQSIVAANGDEGVDAVLFHVLDDLLGVALVLVGVGAGGVEDGAALFEDVADVVHGEGHRAVLFPLQKAAPTALDAQDLVAVVVDGLHGHGPDHTVQPRRVPAAREHPDPVHLGHLCLPLSGPFLESSVY